jgi:hypothetical protein
VSAARTAALATAAAAVLGLAITVVDGVPRTVESLEAEHRRFDGLDRPEREQTFGAAVPVPMEIFDFYRRNLRADDRFYVQAPAEAFGQFADKETVVRNVARYYLLPAVEVERPEDATVVLSYDSDPGLLPLEYSGQIRAGLQLIFVSRVRR